MAARHSELPYLLTVEQAAELLQLHPETVRLQARQGRLPAKKFGRTWRILRDELLRNVPSNATPDSSRGASFPRHSALAADDAGVMISQREAAEILGVSRDTIARMIDRGELVAEATGPRGGARRVYRHDALQAAARRAAASS
jgi:excisionase family DNA binding protein